jgi:uncharacterized alpha-E superfamily protein
MMLSRVADSLCWMSRYLERAEHTARLVDVTLDLLPERSPGSVGQAWERLFTSLNLTPPEGPAPEARAVLQLLTFDAANSSSVCSCIATARENARQVREQISSEMWEQINRLYLDVKNTSADAVWEAQPHQFFQLVKQGSHLFQGITDSTMSQGEGWHFIQVGRYIERTSNVAALLNAHLRGLPADASDPATDLYLDWVGLLRSCTALEAYCKVFSAETRFDSIAEFLLLNEEFPHSVSFGVRMLRDALGAIADAAGTHRNSQVTRRVGRLKAMLEFDLIDEVISRDLHAYLDDVLHQCAQIHTALYQTYIHYPVSEKLPA